MVPSSGSMAVCPPSARRWPTGYPGRPGRPIRVLLGPLRAVVPDRVDRRQVQHVEPQPATSGTRRRSPFKAPVASGETARTRRRPAARSRSTHRVAGAAAVRSAAPRDPAGPPPPAGRQGGPHPDGTLERRVRQGVEGRASRRVSRASGGAVRLAFGDLDADRLTGVQLGPDLVRQVACRSVQASTTSGAADAARDERRFPFVVARGVPERRDRLRSPRGPSAGGAGPGRPAVVALLETAAGPDRLARPPPWRSGRWGVEGGRLRSTSRPVTLHLR